MDLRPVLNLIQDPGLGWQKCLSGGFMKGKRFVLFLTLLGGAEYCSAHQPREAVNFFDTFEGGGKKHSALRSTSANVTVQSNSKEPVTSKWGDRVRRWWHGRSTRSK